MILIIDCGSTKVAALERLFALHKLIYKTVHYTEVETIAMRSFTACFISGSPLLLTQIDAAKEIHRFQFLKTITIPVFGICFGHQIIALVFGGSVHIHQPIKSFIDIHITHPSPLLKKVAPLSFDQNHCETVSLPPCFQLIGRSDNCENEIMQHQDLPLFSVQFHPETSDRQGEQLILRFLSYYGISNK